MPDFESLFNATPDAYVALSAQPGQVILGANAAYLELTGTQREQIVGRPLFEVFPANPADIDGRHIEAVSTSLHLAIATGERHTLPAQQLDLRRSAAQGGEFEERFWRVCHVPVRGPAGDVEQVLQRLEDVTSWVRLQRTEREQTRVRETLASRSEELAHTRRQLDEHREQLQAARTHLDAAMSAGDVATFIWEPQGDRVFADENLARWFDLPRDASGRSSLSDHLAVVHPDDLPALRESIQRSLDGAFQPEAEFRVRQGAGWRHVLARTRVETDAAGRPRRFIGIVLDITELRRTSAELMEAREQLHLAADAAEIGTFSWSLPPGHMTWSRRCKEHLGLPPDARESLEAFLATLHPEDRANTQATIEHSVSALQPYDMEYRTVAADGRMRWVHARGRAFTDARTGVTHFDGITMDVTRQKRIEERLTASEARYRQVVDSLQDYAIFLQDDDGYVTDWNAGAERLLGYTEAEIIGRHCRIFFTPEDRERGEPEKEIITAKRDGHANDDRWHLRKDGSRFFVTGLMAALTAPSGRRIGLAKIMRDITDRQLAAAERDRLLESERAARAEVERTSRLKDDFLATLSHELRTPLNAILGWSQVLKEGGLSPAELYEGLEVIDRNTHVQAQLIEDLLDMSRIVSGKVRLKVAPVDLTAAIEAAIESVRATAAAREIDVRIRFGHDRAVVTGDRTRLQQVVWNLLTNAIKFSPRQGRIEITTGWVDSQVSVAVRDHGGGIAPDFLPHVFERFRQADASTTRQHGGLGIGLSIVKQLVELHGGQVHVESPGLGQGATFTVILPATAGGQPGEPAPTARKLLARTDLSGLRVLVVDDEPDSANLVKRVLDGHAATVQTAGSMHEALTAFVDFRPDLLLSDIGMPWHDGYELIRKIRELPGGAGVPAAALTALARADDVSQALAAGFRTHVAKPVEPAELLAVVAHLTGRGH